MHDPQGGAWLCGAADGVTIAHVEHEADAHLIVAAVQAFDASTWGLMPRGEAPTITAAVETARQLLEQPSHQEGE